MNFNYDEQLMDCETIETNKVDQNQPITACECELLPHQVKYPCFVKGLLQ